jgi:hypothetical protein
MRFDCAKTGTIYADILRQGSLRVGAGWLDCAENMMRLS